MRNNYISSTVSNPHTFPAAVTQPATPEPERRGLGDLVHAVLSVLGIVRLVKAVERRTGRPCGCAARRAALNKLSTPKNA